MLNFQVGTLSNCRLSGEFLQCLQGGESQISGGYGSVWDPRRSECHREVPLMKSTREGPSLGFSVIRWGATDTTYWTNTTTIFVCFLSSLNLHFCLSKKLCKKGYDISNIRPFLSLKLGLPHCFPSVQFRRSVVSNSLLPHEPQHARPPCPSPTPRVYPNPCPLSRWCHPTISSSVFPFSSCLQSFPASGSFQMSQLFASGGQSIGVSASAWVLPMNTQDWSALGWAGWISLQSKGLSRVFSNTTVQKHQFFGTQLSL